MSVSMCRWERGRKVAQHCWLEEEEEEVRDKRIETREEGDSGGGGDKKYFQGEEQHLFEQNMLFSPSHGQGPPTFSSTITTIDPKAHEEKGKRGVSITEWGHSRGSGELVSLLQRLAYPFAPDAVCTPVYQLHT